jgi:hypothetical protein
MSSSDRPSRSSRTPRGQVRRRHTVTFSEAVTIADDPFEQGENALYRESVDQAVSEEPSGVGLGRCCSGRGTGCSGATHSAAGGKNAQVVDSHPGARRTRSTPSAA